MVVTGKEGKGEEEGRKGVRLAEMDGWREEEGKDAEG